MPLLEALLAQFGIEKNRFHWGWISGAEAPRWAQLARDFTEQVRALGPSTGTASWQARRIDMATQAKLKLALYWAASCGGCEIAMVELREKLLVVDEVAEILFWPVAMDYKYKDVEAMPDRHIDVCLFNGAIRTSENEHLAHLMRRKSKVLVAFGSCACEGCIPGLANLYDRNSIFEYVYRESPSVDNPGNVVPKRVCRGGRGNPDSQVL